MEYIAKPYVNALLSLSANRHDRLDWLVFLKETAELVKVHVIKQLINTPTISKQDKKNTCCSLLEKVLEKPLLSAQTNFIGLLIDNHRFMQTPTIYQLFNQANSEGKSRLITINSAYDLSPKERQQLTVKLESKYQTKVVLEAHTDPSLLGGAILKEGDKVTNNSIQVKLEKLGDFLSINE